MLVNIDKINVADRIRRDFGNIEELAQDIKENGLINPPVVTPDMVLIAGERRLKACKQLGFLQIEVRVMAVRDYEHQLRLEIAENEKRKSFTFSEGMVWARRLEQIESLKAKERMGQGKENFPELGQTRDIVAEQAGFGSGKNYEKAKFIADNADEETIQKLDEETISINRAYLKTKEEVARLKTELAEAENRPPKVIEKEVTPPDYEQTKQQLKEKGRELDKKNEELLALTRSQMLQKDRYLVHDIIQDLIQSVGKFKSQAELEVRKLSGDGEIHEDVMNCVEMLENTADQMREWVTYKEGVIIDV